MCLIVYSPQGKLLQRRVFDFARAENPDGIGIMSARGVEKFCGRKAGKRAWRYLRQIEGTPYGLHFRWRTHGAIGTALCHPFKAPRSDAYVMHNGIISATADLATDTQSDTSLFVEHCMGGTPRPGTARYRPFFDAVEQMIGWGNKLLVYHSIANMFTLCNEDAGEWIDGFWYSNDYSLPYDMRSYGNWLAACSALPPESDDEYSGKVHDCLDRSSNYLDYYRELEGHPEYYDQGAAVRRFEGRTGREDADTAD